MVSADRSARRGSGSLQPQLETHHEVDPSGGIPPKRGHHRRALLGRDAVALEDLHDLRALRVGDLLDLPLLARPLARVVLHVAARGEVPAETHRDRARRDLGDPRGDDDPGRIDRAGEPGGQGERNGEAVGHADHDVAHGLARGEVLFEVRRCRHRLPSSGPPPNAPAEARRAGRAVGSRRRRAAPRAGWTRWDSRDSASPTPDGTCA